MKLQHERIGTLCSELCLHSVPVRYPELAGHAAEKNQSFSDFLETVLAAEHAARQGRTRSTMTRLAGFPAIKTLEDFDYEFAPGVPKATIAELSGLACQGQPNFPQLCKLNLPYPVQDSVVSSARTRPALSFSLSR